MTELTAPVWKFIYGSGWDAAVDTRIYSDNYDAVGVIPGENLETWVSAIGARDLKPGIAHVRLFPALSAPTNSLSASG